MRIYPIVKNFVIMLFLMKSPSLILILSFLVISVCLMMNSPNANAQKNTGLTPMTLASVDNTNDSSFTSSASIDKPIQNKTVNYFTNTSGYLVYPVINQSESTKKLPAVVMIHENKGLNNYIKESANILARNGYVVLAVDLFNGVVTTDPAKSSELTSAIRENPEMAICKP